MNLKPSIFKSNDYLHKNIYVDVQYFHCKKYESTYQLDVK